MTERITHEVVARLAATDYFKRDAMNAPACVAILPFVKPEYVGVEIGAFMGWSSALFIEHCAHMLLIDPCREYPENVDKGWFTVAEDLFRTLEPYRGRFTFMPDMSAAAAPGVPDVDFVFIDGNHAYQFVRQDIELYWPKVRPGGFLSGHDYNQADVKRAVNEFFGVLGLPVEHHQDCWLVHKPI